MIEVTNLKKNFGGFTALNNINLKINKGNITGLIGPNGAGKSTLFNIIAGLYKPSVGNIFLNEEDVTNLSSNELFHKGLLRTFQIAHEFPTLTVLENLMMVPPNQLGEKIINTWFKRKKIKAQEANIEKKAREITNFLKISHLNNAKAGTLSGGQKKLLELARTMMVDAKIILLDEIGAGVNKTLLKQIGDAIIDLNTEYGMTFCMIEHDMDFISRLCDPVVVLANGEIIAVDNANNIMNSDKVIEVYLGV